MKKVLWLLFLIWIGFRTAALGMTSVKHALTTTKRFVVVYPGHQSDAWITVLSNAIDSLPLYYALDDDQKNPTNKTFASSVWLYSHTETANKHIPGHWEAMWSFQCGRTSGRWPWCGGKTNKIDLDPQDATTPELREWTQGHLVYGLKHGKTAPKNHRVHRHQRPRPLACGFGISLDIITPEIMDFFLKQKIRILLLTAGSPVLSSMLVLSQDYFDAGLHNHPVSKKTTVMTSSHDFGKHNKRKNVHRLYCGGQDSSQSLIDLIQGLANEEKHASQFLSDSSTLYVDLPIFVQDGPEFFLMPKVPLGLMYAFVLDRIDPLTLSEMKSLVISSKVEHEMHSLMTPHPQVLLDCLMTLEAVRFHFVVEGGSGSVVEKLDELLDLIHLIKMLPKKKKTSRQNRVSRIWETRLDILDPQQDVEDKQAVMDSNIETWGKGNRRQRYHRS